MPDFTKMVTDARAEHDAKVSDAAKKLDAERAARKAFADSAIAALNAYVRPLLKQAADDFRKSGIDTKIEEYFDIYNRVVDVKPGIALWCLGPKRSSDGYQWGARKAFFTSDGKTIFAGHAEDYNKDLQTEIGKAPVGASEDIITKAIKGALDGYYEALRSKPRWTERS